MTRRHCNNYCEIYCWSREKKHKTGVAKPFLTDDGIQGSEVVYFTNVSFEKTTKQSWRISSYFYPLFPNDTSCSVICSRPYNNPSAHRKSPRICLLSFPASRVIYFPCCCELVWHGVRGRLTLLLSVGLVPFNTELKVSAYSRRWRLWERSETDRWRTAAQTDEESSSLSAVAVASSSVVPSRCFLIMESPRSGSPLPRSPSACPSVRHRPVFAPPHPLLTTVSETTATPRPLTLSNTAGLEKKLFPKRVSSRGRLRPQSLSFGC